MSLGNVNALSEYSDRTVVGNPKQVLLRESVITSTAWGALASVVLEKALVEYFRESPYLKNVKKVVSTLTGVNDFRFKERYLLGDATDLAEITEQGTCPQSYVDHCRSKTAIQNHPKRRTCALHPRDCARGQNVPAFNTKCARSFLCRFFQRALPHLTIPSKEVVS